MTLKYIQKTTEFQVFDRKSVKIDAKTLTITIIAFANADGGKIALGVEDDGTLTGVDGQTAHVNELLRAGFDFCVPSITTSTEYMEVTDVRGEVNLKEENNQEELSRDQEFAKLSLCSHQVVTKLSSSIPTIVTLLRKLVEPMSAREMREFCGLKDASYYKTNVIDPLIKAGLIEMTHPYSPKSPTQRYRLTDNGRKLLDPR